MAGGSHPGPLTFPDSQLLQVVSQDPAPGGGGRSPVSQPHPRSWVAECRGRGPRAGPPGRRRTPHLLASGAGVRVQLEAERCPIAKGLGCPFSHSSRLWGPSGLRSVQVASGSSLQGHLRNSAEHSVSFPRAQFHRVGSGPHHPASCVTGGHLSAQRATRALRPGSQLTWPAGQAQTPCWAAVSTFPHQGRFHGSTCPGPWMGVQYVCRVCHAVCS